MAHGHGGHHGGRGRGWWGGGWGWPGWGWGGYPYAYPFGYPYAAALPVAPAYPYAAAAYAPGAVVVGQDAGPAPAAAMVPAMPDAMAPYGGPTSRVAVMSQMVAFRNAAGCGMLQSICPLGIHRKKVKKHHTTTVVACPQVLYKVNQLMIPSHVARHFEIKSIRVGLQEFLVSRAGIPADVFSNKSFTPFVINLPGPILPGQRIYIRVKNTSRHKKWFRGAFDGLALS